MTASGVFYPSGADTAEERLRYYAEPLPAGRGRRHVLRAARRRHRQAVGRPDAARLHLRHQGARADDRPGHRDEAPAEGDPRRAPRPSSRASADLRQGPPARGPRCGLGDVPRRPRAARRGAASWARSCSSTRAGSSRRRRTAATIEDAVERLDGWPCAVEFRNASWLNEKNAERTLRFLADRGIAFVMVDEPQGFKSSVPPVTAVTSKDLAMVRFHGRNARPGRPRGSPRPSGSATSTRGRSSASGSPGSARRPARRSDTHVLMNNCYANYGTTNAREIAALLNGD